MTPGRDEAERLRCSVEIEPGRAALGPGDPRVAVHVDRAHRREVDHEPAVANAVAGGIVSASTHGHLQFAGPSEIEGGRDVGGADAASDHGRVAVDESVEAATRRVVLCIARADDAADERPP